MLGIDAAFFVLELGVGLIVGSLALMADAFHMVSKIEGVGHKDQTNCCTAE
jgi:zinc transporter 1